MNSEIEDFSPWKVRESKEFTHEETRVLFLLDQGYSYTSIKTHSVHGAGYKMGTRF